MKTHKKTRRALLAVLVLVAACAALYFGDSRIRDAIQPTRTAKPTLGTGGAGKTIDVSFDRMARADRRP
jgi:hypothetical protein